MRQAQFVPYLVLHGRKDAPTGNYSVDTTSSMAIEPEPFETAYSVREMNEIFERGMKRVHRSCGAPERSGTQ